jgi:hypothetical protein
LKTASCPLPLCLRAGPSMTEKDVKRMLERKWQFLLLSDLNSVVHHEGLAKLGDAFVNFSYSLAKSTATGEPTGCKVPDAVLANAYRTSLLAQIPEINIRGRKGKVGDSVEALLLWSWLTGVLSIDVLVTTLSENLDASSLGHSRSEAEGAVKAFSAALNLLATHLSEKNRRSELKRDRELAQAGQQIA